MIASLYKFVIDELQARKGSWGQIADAVGMSKRTLEKIARKEIKNPGIHSCERLANFFYSQK